MEERLHVSHHGQRRDDIEREVGSPVSTFRQGATAMSDDRIKQRVAGALERAKEREGGQLIGRVVVPAAVIVDLVVEEAKLKERRAELMAEVQKLELTLAAVEHLKQVYGTKGGGG